MNSNAFAGYYEMPYFISNYFYQTVSTTNYNSFSGVTFYNSYYSLSSTNYESLFAFYDVSAGSGSAPASNSLFNL